MVDPKHERLRSLFDRALELPTAEREAMLVRECGADPKLKQRLDLMLAAATDAHFLAAPTGVEGSHAPPPAAEAALHEGPGTRIGPYKLLQQIGEGGFGVVFLAQQEQPVTRKVALKIIKLGMDTRQVVARFEQERQALALMDHANIARVLDAGATETGRPYFVMDLVKGAPIVDYCDKNNLTIDERLALFAQVCHAVQHAHGKGIIHRDLKPSNILVGIQDGRPQAKIIDFGIAKATSQKLTDRTLFTEHQQVIGTLQYMSPEQAEGSLDIDTRTDVYSLGVLLYELLTGSTPFDKKTLGDAMFLELQRIIREVEPPKPSTRLSNSHELLAGIAAHRRVEPRRLGLLLRGELDWMVMKALEKDRRRRYETASALASDIERYLTGEPVLAAPPSATYRLRKFVRRYRGTVSAIATTGLALLLGIVGFAWQASIARDERDLAVQAKLDATTARGKAEAVSKFMLDALRSADPKQGGTQGMLVADAMSRAVVLLDGGAFATQPAVELELRTTIAEVLSNNGRSEAALAQAEAALQLTRRQFPGDNDEVADSLNALAFVEDRLGRLTAATAHHREALGMRQRLHPGDHIAVAVSLSNLGLCLLDAGQAAAAEPMLAESLLMTSRLLPGDNGSAFAAISNLAVVRRELGQLEAADKLDLEALQMARRLHPGDHPDIATALNNLGQSNWSQGRAKDALPRFEEALAMYRRLYHGDHPEVATALCNLAATRQALGQRTEAEPLLREGLAMFQRLFPGDHPRTASALDSLGELLQAMGRLDDAAAPLGEALAMRERLFPDSHPEVVASLQRLASLHEGQGNFAAAEPLCVRALSMQEQLTPGDAAEIAQAYIGLALVQHALGKRDRENENFAAAIAMQRRLDPAGSVPLANALWVAGRARTKSDAPGALKLFEEAEALGARLLPAQHPQLLKYRASLAECRTIVGR